MRPLYDKVEKVLLKQNNKIRAYTTGTLCLTPAFMIFIEPTGARETWVCYVMTYCAVTLTTTGFVSSC